MGVFVARFVGVTCPSRRVDVRRVRVDLRTGAASDLSSVENRNTSCTHMPRRSTPIATIAVTVAGSDMSSLSSCMVAAKGRARVGQCAPDARAAMRRFSAAAANGYLVRQNGIAKTVFWLCCYAPSKPTAKTPRANASRRTMRVAMRGALLLASLALLSSPARDAPRPGLSVAPFGGFRPRWRWIWR